LVTKPRSLILVMDTLLTLILNSCDINWDCALFVLFNDMNYLPEKRDAAIFYFATWGGGGGGGGGSCHYG
jgi:hypothetical protein